MLEQNAAQIAEHDARIDAVGAVQGAAVAASALAPGRVHALHHKFRIHLALAAQHLAQGGLDFIRRNLLGVVIVGFVKKATVRTHSAVGTDFEPSARAGFTGFFQIAGQSFLVHFHFFHLTVILCAALVLQQIKDAFLGGDRDVVAQGLGHCLLLSGKKIFR